MTGSGRYRLTPAADNDVAAVLSETRTRFGTRQQDVYAALIASAIRLVAAEPMRPGSKDRSDLEEGLRSFPLALAAGRRRAAAHILYYRVAAGRGADGIEVIRVLHHSMDPRFQLFGAPPG